MELRWTASSEEEIRAIESTLFCFFSFIGVEPEEVFESRVEKTPKGFELFVSFVPSQSLTLKMKKACPVLLPRPPETPRRTKGIVPPRTFLKPRDFNA